ncbi:MULTISPECIES: hypothetical protein [unclassified Streptomyces]|uniref:hypothetical protein n=1 Tax=Streptomyces sp. SID4950 TaxID=2690288 RepID=UPI00081B0F8C|nr:MULTISPECIES: hypothetical protein [unclassified Streptomyces]SCE52458.1 hypothetical protein GA0115242_14654 [Streptomyces sp. SolWspMP-5a-2]
MAVGAAHAERADTGDEFPVRGAGGRRAVGPRAEFPLDAQVQLVEGDAGAGLLEVEAGGQLPVFEGEDDFDEARDPGGTGEVTDVGLDGADGEGAVGGPVAADGPAERGGFDGVAGGRAGAVQFDVADRFRGDARGVAGAGEDVGLGVGGRGGEGRSGRVVVGRAAAHQAQDLVAVRERGLEALQDDGAAALARYVAVGALVEREAAALGRQGAEAVGEQHALRQQVEVDTADERGVGLSRAQALARQVEGHQGGRLGGVDGDAGTAGAQEGGQAVREDTALHAEHRVLRGEGVDVRGEQVRVVVPGDADEGAHPAPAHPLRNDAGVLQRLPSQLQGEPLLRVDERRLAGRDPEERGVEPGHVLQEGPPAGRLPRGGSRPPVGGHLADAAPARGQQPPQRVGVRGSGEAARDADDGECRALAVRCRHVCDSLDPCGRNADDGCRPAPGRSGNKPSGIRRSALPVNSSRFHRHAGKISAKSDVTAPGKECGRCRTPLRAMFSVSRPAVPGRAARGVGLSRARAGSGGPGCGPPGARTPGHVR